MFTKGRDKCLVVSLLPSSAPNKILGNPALALHWAVPASLTGLEVVLETCARDRKGKAQWTWVLPATLKVGDAACSIAFLHLQAPVGFSFLGSIEGLMMVSVPKSLPCIQRSVFVWRMGGGARINNIFSLHIKRHCL